MIAGQKVVVTGAIAGHSRATAEASLREAGAFVQSSVTAETDVLVTGARVGKTKTDKARALGVLVVAWEDLWESEALDRALGAVPDQPDDFDEVAEEGRRITIRESVPVTAPKATPLSVRQVGPMLAKAGDLPIGDRWRYEVKWDGYRCVATVKDGAVWMASRSAKTEYAEQFPRIATALSGLPDCVLDGELVAFEADGSHSFAGIHTGGGAVFMVFDLIEFMEEGGPHPGVRPGDLRVEPWYYRRQMLESFAEHWNSPYLELSPVFEDGEALLEEVAERGLEGVVAKPVTASYHEGSRADWVKIKVRSEQEFVVVGWTPGKGSLVGEIGALHLAVNEDSGLVYVGKVGTGRDLAFWQELAKRFTEVDQAPIDTKAWTPAERREANWVQPEVVVQVRFQRWTEDGRLWHPSLQGVREDKAAGEVRRSA
jgi:bifunctional non-homologous end joining protein LigD